MPWWDRCRWHSRPRIMTLLVDNYSDTFEFAKSGVQNTLVVLFFWTHCICMWLVWICIVTCRIHWTVCWHWHTLQLLKYWQVVLSTITLTQCVAVVMLAYKQCRINIFWGHKHPFASEASRNFLVVCTPYCDRAFEWSGGRTFWHFTTWICTFLLLFYISIYTYFINVHLVWCVVLLPCWYPKHVFSVLMG